MGRIRRVETEEGTLLLNIPWVESPLFPKLLAEAQLPREQENLVRTYAERGYVVFDFPAADIDRLARKIRTSLSHTSEAPHGRVQDAWKSCISIRSIAANTDILAMLRLLYRREPIPFQTLNFPVGTEQLTHSDTIHFHCIPHRFMCGVWVALEDVDDDNGPLHVYPGSHKLPVWDMHALGLPSGCESYGIYEQAICAIVEELGLQKEPVLLKKGQAVVWAANLLHGGEYIRDPARTRLSQATHYFFEHCLYYTPMHSDPFLGTVAFRDIINIVDGRGVPNTYGGKPLPPSIVGHRRGEVTMEREEECSVPRRAIIRRVLRRLWEVRVGG